MRRLRLSAFQHSRNLRRSNEPLDEKRQEPLILHSKSAISVSEFGVTSDFGVTASQTPGTRNRASHRIRGGSQPLIPFEVESQHFRYFRFRHTRNLDDKEPGCLALKILKSRNATCLGVNFGISAFRHFGCREVEEAVIFGIESFKLPVHEKLKDPESSDRGGSQP
jgi:hypothetical protein